MSPLPPSSPRHRAWLVLGGGWLASVAALTLGAELAPWKAPVLLPIALGWLVVTWLVLFLWERRFRRRHAAGWPTHAALVPVPLMIAVLLLVFGPAYNRHAPGGHTIATQYSLTLPEPEGLRIHLDLDRRKENWGTELTESSFVSSSVFVERAHRWDLDAAGRTATRGDTTIALDEDGWRHVLLDLAPAVPADDLAPLIRSLQDYTIHNQGPLPTPMRPHPWLSAAGIGQSRFGMRPVAIWPWHWIALGAFALLLVPLSGCTLRRIPPRADPRP